MEEDNLIENQDLIEEDLEKNKQAGFDFTTPTPNQGNTTGPVSEWTENLTGNVLDTIDNVFQGDQKSKSEILSDRAQQRVNAQVGEEERQEALNESTNFFDVIAREGVRVPLGAIEDAAHSVLLTADKTGDEIKKQINQSLGRPVTPDQDPSSDEYESWYDGSNKIIAENQTGIGKFARGLSEFFVLTRWTGKALGPAKANFNPNLMMGANQTKIVRAAHPMYQSNRFMRIATGGGRKIWQIGTEGAIADFIMSSSEGQNMANLAEEHAPWLLPDLMNALAANPEDTWYQERLKSALVGTGFNFIGYTVGSLVKASWTFGRWLLKQKADGKSITEELLKEGDKIFNTEFNKGLEEGMIKDQKLGDRLSRIRYDSGKGINPENARTDYILKHLDLDDQAEYARMLEGADPSDAYVKEFKKRLGADFDLDIRLNETDMSLREIIMNDLEEFAERVGARAGDPWIPAQNMSLVQRAEAAIRETDEIVNADKYPDYDKQSYDGGFVKYDEVTNDYKVDIEEIDKAIKERQWNWEERRSLETVFRSVDEPYISQAAAGNKDLYEIYKEVAEDLDRLSMGMKEQNFSTDLEVDLAMARPFLESIEKFIDGKPIDLVKEYKRVLKELRKRGAAGTVEYKYPRDPSDLTKSGRIRTVNITTPDPLTVRANMFVLHSLGKFTAQLAKGTLTINNKLPTARNWDMFTDLMKVIMIENKKWGYNWGRAGQARQGGVADLFRKLQKPPKEILKNIQADVEDVVSNLKDLYRAGDMEAVNDLLTMALITEGKVNSIDQIGEYLGKYLRGGVMRDANGEFKNIDSRIMRETYQTVINSWLGHPKTAVNSIFMTNLLNISRLMEQWYGIHGPIVKQWRRHKFDKDALKGTIYEGLDFDGFNKTKSRLIGVQYASMLRAQKEAWQMFMRNWEINNKPQVFDINGKPALDSEGKQLFRMPDYTTRFEDGTSDRQWVEMSNMYEKYGTWGQKRGKDFVDIFFNINKLPIMRWSRSAMNAGDAYTRTIIGRMEMSVRVAEEALKQGIDPDDLAAFAKANDELFRKEIFRKNKDDVWVVKDPRAKNIADEVTLMKPLPDAIRGVQALERNPITQRFFAFLRPAFNNFGNTLDRTPIKMLMGQYDDIVRRNDGTRWGLTPDQVPRAKDELIGRVALGTTLASILVGYARTGMLIGDYPKDENDRKWWKMRGIQPNSFAIPKPWNPLKQERGDNGWLYISFGRSDVASTLFSFAANLVYYEGVVGENYFDEATEKIKWLTASALADTGFIQSANNLISVLDGTTDKGENLERIGARLVRPMLGLQGQSKFLADIFDNTRKESNTFLEYATQHDVIFKSNVPNDYDVLGKKRGVGNAQPLRYGPHNVGMRFLHSLLPFQPTLTEGDSLKKQLHEIGYDLNVEFTSLKGVKLNSQERSDLKLVLAEDKDLRSELETLVNSKSWKVNLEDYIEAKKKNVDGWETKEEYFYKAVNAVFKRAKDRAVIALKDPKRFPEYNSNKPESLFSRITIRGYQKQISATGDVDLKKSLTEQVEELKKHGL